MGLDLFVKIKKFKFLILVLIIPTAFCVFMFHLWYTNQELRDLNRKCALKISNLTTKLHPADKDNEILGTIQCYEQSLEPRLEQHGRFWVLYNYVRAEKEYKCNESVTFTTQGDYLFLDNIVTIVKRWKGPVSVALHAPGTDFMPTLRSIAYLRECETDLIKKFVTFHLVINARHFPKMSDAEVPITDTYKDGFKCSHGPPYSKMTFKDLYKKHAGLSYPINIARNVAKQASQTHYVLAADIELYPSINLIGDFLHMIIHKPNLTISNQLVVYALPVFEIVDGQLPPENKSELLTMLNNKKAFSFHKNICNNCHAIPNLKQWMNLKYSADLDIFTKTKRQGTQVRWEAVYVGTRDDPAFDERLDWEKHGNKMAQAYILCIMDYDYLVLNNAFMVHRPGIKKKMVNAKVIPKTAKYIKQVLGKQLNTLLGSRRGCVP